MAAAVDDSSATAPPPTADSSATAPPTNEAPAAPDSRKKSTLDPLVLLRQQAMAGQKVRLLDELLDFDGLLIHKSAKCGFKLSPQDPCLDIGSIWFMFKEISNDKPYTASHSKKAGFTYIGVGYRGDLCDYLVGRTNTCQGLVLDIIEGRKRPKDDGAGGAIRKRFRLPAKQDQAEAAAAAASQEGAKASGGVVDVKASDICLADVLARVRPVQDLDVLVRCPGRTVPNADLVLKIAQDEVNNWNLPAHRRASQAEMQADGGKVPFIRELEKLLAEDPKAKPIILVPCNKKAPVNILNAMALLQDGMYERATEEKTRFFESTRPEYVDIVRNIDGKLWTFEVRDSAKNFTKNHWLRVVAVVADGTDWQYKGWPFESIVDVFTTSLGVYFREVGKLTPAHVKTWAVTVLEMATVQFQHRFAAMRDQFWGDVERFLFSFRVKKFVNHTTLDSVDISHEKALPVL